MIDIQTQTAIDNYLKNEMIPRVNAIAREKICAVIPEWKQANYTARTTQLNFYVNSQNRPYTQAELDEVAFMEVFLLKIEAIRAASNVHCANLQALTTLEDINSYDMSVGWP